MEEVCEDTVYTCGVDLHPQIPPDKRFQPLKDKELHTDTRARCTDHIHSWYYQEFPSEEQICTWCMKPLTEDQQKYMELLLKKPMPHGVLSRLMLRE